MVFSLACMRGGVAIAVGYKPICNFRFSPKVAIIFGDILPIRIRNVDIFDLSHNCLKNKILYS